MSVGELQGEDVIVFRLMGDCSEFPLKKGSRDGLSWKAGEIR